MGRNSKDPNGIVCERNGPTFDIGWFVLMFFNFLTASRGKYLKVNGCTLKGSKSFTFNFPLSKVQIIFKDFFACMSIFFFEWWMGYDFPGGNQKVFFCKNEEKIGCTHTAQNL